MTGLTFLLMQDSVFMFFKCWLSVPILISSL